MKTFVVNGKFMADRMQGIVRYGREILNELESLLNGDVKVILALPSNATLVPSFKKIETVTLGCRTGIVWEQLDLASYMRKHKDYALINFCNVAPFFVKPGITTVHDIMYKVFPQNYKSLRNRISRLWHCIQYSYVFKHEKQIITVSEFSKGEIEKHYPSARGKVCVIPNGWQHVLKYQENTKWREKYPDLVPGQFYFSLATLSFNKNGKWIIEEAKNNPDCIFAMGGKIYEDCLDEIPSNVKLLGFVEDPDACALLKNCKAFLFPSLYEGFGIPPLEALAFGAKVVSSNTSSLPEVLGQSACFIDPLVYSYNLKDIELSSSKEALDRYSWASSAGKLLEVMKNYE